MSSTRVKVPIIVGPTAVGKTGLSILLAKIYGGEVISADSRQFYCHLDIGTAKVTKKEQNEVPHHFIDILDPSEYYSAGMFARDARNKIAEIQKKRILPIVVGGSGLYIRALVDGIFEHDAKDVELRNKLDQRVDKEGLSTLFDELKQVDAQYAAKLNSNDKRRILRALEVYQLTGRSFSEWHQEKPQVADFEPVFIGLNAERELLYKRINERVDKMFKLGLADEVNNLIRLGFGRQLNALNTVGYKEVFSWLANEISEPEMIELIKRNSRRYAKRQLTWFKPDQRIHWFNVSNTQSLLKISASVQQFLV